MFELYLDLDRRLLVRRGAHGYRFSLELAGETVLEGLRLRERDGESAVWTLVEMGDGALALTGVIGKRWKLTAEVAVSGQRSPRTAWQIQAMYVGEHPATTAFDVEWDVPIAAAKPFVPGVFYGENRTAGASPGPRWSPVDEPDDPASSPAWRFRTDRAMTPFAMLRANGRSAAVVTPDRFSHGASGLGFSAKAKGGTLSLHFPYRESPIRNADFDPDGDKPLSVPFAVHAGETVCFSFEAYAGRSGGRALLRDLYDADTGKLNPWMPGTEAAELSARGILDWHYDPVQRVLYETAGFDRYFRPGPKPWDRRQMDVSGPSGLAYAYALACHGSRVNSHTCLSAGLDVIDKIARDGIAPGGMFYTRWTEDGWCGASQADGEEPAVVQSRTAAEAAWFLMKALTAPEAWATGARLECWEDAARTNLDHALSAQRADGCFGANCDMQTGAAMDWDGAGGLMWVPALLMGARYRNASGRVFPNADRYRAAALDAGGYYARMVGDHALAAGGSDGVASRSAFDALIAMLALYEETATARWLDIACEAADIALSFRMSYNATFDEETLLGRYDYRTKGADVGSPADQHLHNYGLVCLPALLRLWRLTGDDYYFDRARDQLFCFRQFIARKDGDFNARRGMVPAQLFHTDWTHPKGMVLPVSQACSSGWIVCMEDWVQSFGNLFVDPARQRLYRLECVDVVDEDWEGRAVVLRNPWDRDIDLAVVNIATAHRAVFHLPAGQTHVYQIQGLEEGP